MHADMHTQTTADPSHVIGYTISDAAGNYSATATYQTYEEAVSRCDRSSGEAVGAVLSDGSVTFEV